MPPTEDRIPSSLCHPDDSGVLWPSSFFIGLVQRHGELSLMAGLVLFRFLAGPMGGSKLSSARLKCRMTVGQAAHVSGRRFFRWLFWVEKRQTAAHMGSGFQVSEYETKPMRLPPMPSFTGQCGLLWYQKNPVPLAGDGLAGAGSTPWGLPYVTTADLFGFFPHPPSGEAGRNHRVSQVDPPQPIGSPPKEHVRYARYAQPGPGSGIYIRGHGDYQAGRPSRFIHWKASARHHRLQEKVFDPSEQEKGCPGIGCRRLCHPMRPGRNLNKPLR